MQGLVFEKVEGLAGMGLEDTLGELEGVDDRVLEFEGVCGMVWELEGVDA